MLSLMIDKTAPELVQQIADETDLLRDYGVTITNNPAVRICGLSGRPHPAPTAVISPCTDAELTAAERRWWDRDEFLCLLRPVAAKGAVCFTSCLGQAGEPGDAVWICHENRLGRVPVVSRDPPDTWPPLIRGIHYMREISPVDPRMATESMRGITPAVLLRRLLSCLPPDYYNFAP